MADDRTRERTMSNLQLDTVFIQQLRIDTIVGILPEERTNPQTIFLDIDLTTDVRTPARTKEISDACDYSKLATRVSEFIIKQKFLLIETLAEDVTELILKEFEVAAVKLSISKPQAIAAAGCVGVTITRTR